MAILLCMALICLRVLITRTGAPLNYLDAEQLFVRLLNTQDLDQQLQCALGL